jgi:3-oxoadipate enol-lactonase
MAMPTFTRGSATISYSDTGAPPERADAPTVFFGHALLFSGWMFHPQITALKSQYRCVAIDWRGQGDSPAANDGYDMDTLTDDAVALIESLGVAPIHYVGLSMGGFVGLRIAARRPELIRTLTLLDTSAGPQRDGTKFKLLSTIFRVTGIGVLRKTVVPMVFGPTFRADASNKPVIEEWERRLRRSRRSGISKAVIGVADRLTVESEIGRIQAPTLVIVGAAASPTPPDESQRIVDLIPGARLVTVVDSGHTTTLEQPDTVTELLRNLLTLTG